VQAIFYAGTTLYLWNEVPELMAAFLSACSLEEDMDVFVIASTPRRVVSLRRPVGPPRPRPADRRGDRR